MHTLVMWHRSELTLHWRINITMALASAETNTAETLVSKRKSTSAVWNYFGFKKEDDARRQVLCRACYAKAATSLPIPPVFISPLKKLQQAIAVRNVWDCYCMPYERYSRHHIEVWSLPLSTVSKVGFMALINYLEKQYSMPSRTYFSQTAVPEPHKKCKEKVVMDLKTAYYFAITTDMRSSQTSEPYQSLTVHFIDEDFNLKACSLQTAYFLDDHTRDNVAETCYNLL